MARTHRKYEAEAPAPVTSPEDATLPHLQLVSGSDVPPGECGRRHLSHDERSAILRQVIEKRRRTFLLLEEYDRLP